MTSPSAPPRLFDPARRRLRLQRADRGVLRADALRADVLGAGFLLERAAEDAADSLDAILREFPVAVDLSARPGALKAALAATPSGHAAAARVGTMTPVAGGAAPGETALPLEDGRTDLIVSLLSLHWANDLPGALAQIRRALRPDGLFIGCLFGAGTLGELRAVLTEAELAVRGGAQARVSPFADAHDGAALMQRAGFALPVVDRDRVTATYPDLFALVRDLRAMGETSALAGVVKPLTRGIAARAAALYAERFGDADGRIPATFEIISLTGWAPHEAQPKPLKRGSARTRLADALGVRERRA